MPSKNILVPGVKAGLIGATILAVWFLVIDSINGQPFHTPAFLSSILFGVDGVDRSLGLIAGYTVIHYAAFCLVGVVSAWLLSQFSTSPSLLIGLVLGFVMFDLVFYLGVVVTGVDVVRQLGWPEVLAGNLLAGIGLVGYLHRSLGIRSPAWIEALTTHRIIREGFLVGAIGAVIVAVYFFLFDLARGQPFFTPGALGSAIFLRVEDSTAVQVTLATVGGYTVLHFAVFIVVGLAAAALAVQTEKVPALLLAGILILATAEAFFLGLLAVVAEWLLGALGWLSIGVGNVLAAAGMALYLWRAHPDLREVFRMETLADDDDANERVNLEGTGVPRGP